MSDKELSPVDHDRLKLERPPLEHLPEILKFPELDQALREEIIKATSAGEDIKELINKYLDVAYEFIEQLPATDQDEARLGHSLSLANIKYSATQLCSDEDYRTILWHDYKDRLISAVDLSHTFAMNPTLITEATKNIESARDIIDSEADRVYALVGNRTGSPGPRFQEFE
jgi:hypothetical protein